MHGRQSGMQPWTERARGNHAGILREPGLRYGDRAWIGQRHKPGEQLGGVDGGHTAHRGHSLSFKLVQLLRSADYPVGFGDSTFWIRHTSRCGCHRGTDLRGTSEPGVDSSSEWLLQPGDSKPVSGFLCRDGKLRRRRRISEQRIATCLNHCRRGNSYQHNCFHFTRQPKPGHAALQQWPDSVWQ